MEKSSLSPVSSRRLVPDPALKKISLLHRENKAVKIGTVTM